MHKLAVTVTVMAASPVQPAARGAKSLFSYGLDGLSSNLGFAVR